MAATDNTFDLVKSLTANEKRFFRLFANMTKGEKNYLKIFSVLDRSAHYPARKLKNMFAGKNVNLSYEKNYLQKQILKAMRIFHSENSAENRVNSLLEDVKFFMQKDLLHQAEKSIEKGLRIAEHHQLYEQLLFLLHAAYDVEGNLVRGNPEDSYKKTSAYLKRMTEMQQNIFSIVNYEMLYSNMVEKARVRMRVRNKNERGGLDTIMKHPLMKTKNLQNLPITSLFTYNSIQAFYYFSMSKPVQAFRYASANYELAKANPEAIRITPRLFYNVTHNYMYGCLFARKYDQLKIFMKRYREGYYNFLPIDLNRIKYLMEESLLNYSLALSIYSKDYDLGIKTIADYKARLPEFERIISEEQRMTIYYKMARILLSTGRPKDALYWINSILNETDQATRPDFQCYVRILNLILHYELNNYDLLESMVRSTERFLKRKKMFYKIETVFLGFIKNVLKQDQISGRKKLFRLLKKELMQLHKDPFEKGAFIHFDYLEWVQGKL